VRRPEREEEDRRRRAVDTRARELHARDRDACLLLDRPGSADHLAEPSRGRPAQARNAHQRRRQSRTASLTPAKR
jgi:hypothetical protein